MATSVKGGDRGFLFTFVEVSFGFAPLFVYRTVERVERCPRLSDCGKWWHRRSKESAARTEAIHRTRCPQVHRVLPHELPQRIGCGLHSASTLTDKAGESAHPCACHARLISLVLVLAGLRSDSICRRATRGRHERSPTTYGSQRPARPSPRWPTMGRTSAAPP